MWVVGSIVPSIVFRTRTKYSYVNPFIILRKDQRFPLLGIARGIDIYYKKKNELETFKRLQGTL